MLHEPGPDPIDALERFLARIRPYDPAPDEPVLTVELRLGRSRAEYPLSARAARALTEALDRYSDPDDNGACSHCGKPLNRDLYCVACGYVDGIFGQTVALRAAEVRRRDGADGS